MRLQHQVIIGTVNAKLFIRQFHTMSANQQQSKIINQKMIARSKVFGTNFKVCDNDKLVVSIDN